LLRQKKHTHAARGRGSKHKIFQAHESPSGNGERNRFELKEFSPAQNRSGALCR